MPSLNSIKTRILAAANVLLKGANSLPFEPSYQQDGLVTQHNCDFVRYERFANAYDAGAATRSWGDARIHWRVHTACWAASIGSKLDGDFVECGVNRGGLAMATIRYTNFESLSGKRYFLLDTFKGLAKSHLTGAELDALPGYQYEDCLSVVRKTFAPYETVRIIPGTVPETLAMVDSSKVAYLSLDMNCAMPERAAIEHFWPILATGAIVVLDDYGWRGHIEQKNTLDNFAKDVGVEILSLPTGQGLLIKR